jgi:hypothetical protein
LIYIAADTIEEVVDKMNEDLTLLAVWLCHNKLKLNISKTKWLSHFEKTFKKCWFKSKLAYSPFKRKSTRKSILFKGWGLAAEQIQQHYFVQIDNITPL